MTNDQLKAYKRYIRAAEKVKLIRTKKNLLWEYIPHNEALGSLKADGEHHPLYVPNEAWLEYKEASKEWWAIEPEFRKDERLRASRGDYGEEDSWEDETTDVKDTYELLKGE